MEADTPHKFKIWYADVFSHLEHKTEKGNGAIVALMGAMPLYERWVEANVSPDTKPARMALVDSDLKIGDLTKTEKFWNVVRDGLCHSGSFFVESDTQRKKRWSELPKIGLNKHYPPLPTFVTDPTTGKEAIIFNPWDLIYHILQKYEGNLALLEGPEAPLLPLSYVIPQST